MVGQFEAEKKQLKNAKAADLKVSLDDLDTQTDTEIFRLAANSQASSPKKEFIFESMDEEDKPPKLIGSALKSSYLSMLSNQDGGDALQMSVPMSAERARWEKGKEERYQSEKQNITKLLQMVGQTDKYGEGGFRVMLDRVLHPEYTSMLREQVLGKYTDGDLLIPAHIKYLALTSGSLIDYLENQGYQFFFKVLDPELVRRLELQILRNIVDTYFQTRATLAEENRKFKFDLFSGPQFQASFGPPPNILVKELNSKAAVKRVLESRLFYIQKKKVFKILRDIILSSPTKLITPEDIRKLSVVFTKHREMFSGYRAYLSRPEDRFSSRNSSPMSSRPQTANSILQSSTNPGGTQNPDHILEAIKLEDQAGPDLLKPFSKPAVEELTHILESTNGPQSKNNPTLRAVSAQTAKTLLASKVPIFEASTKKLNRTLKMVKKLVQSTEERLKDQKQLKRRRSRHLTVDGRIVLSELKKIADFVGDEDLPDGEHASRVKKAAVEKCAARVYVLNEPIRYSVSRPVSAEKIQSQPKESEVLEGNTRAKRAAQEAAREAAVTRNKLLERLKPSTISLRPSTAVSDSKIPQSTQSNRTLNSSSIEVARHKDRLASEVAAARKLSTIPAGLTHTQAEVLVACRMDCHKTLEFILAPLTPDQARAAVCFHTGHVDGPLDCAVKQRNLKLAELLLKNGADPNKPFKNGDTPMHIACRFGDRKVDLQTHQMFEKLLKYKGDIRLKNLSGDTPFDAAHFSIFSDEEYLASIESRWTSWRTWNIPEFQEA